MVTKKTSLDVEAALWSKAKLWAQHLDISVGELVTRALEAHLKQLEKKEGVVVKTTDKSGAARSVTLPPLTFLDVMPKDLTAYVVRTTKRPAPQPGKGDKR